LSLAQAVEPYKGEEKECVLGLLGNLVDNTVRNHVKVSGHFRHCSVPKVAKTKVVNHKHVTIADELLQDNREQRVERKQVGEHRVECVLSFVFIAVLLYMTELKGVKHFKVGKSLLERKSELKDLQALLLGNLRL